MCPRCKTFGRNNSYFFVFNSRFYGQVKRNLDLLKAPLNKNWWNCMFCTYSQATLRRCPHPFLLSQIFTNEHFLVVIFSRYIYCNTFSYHFICMHQQLIVMILNLLHHKDDEIFYSRTLIKRPHSFERPDVKVPKIFVIY